MAITISVPLRGVYFVWKLTLTEMLLTAIFREYHAFYYIPIEIIYAETIMHMYINTDI